MKFRAVIICFILLNVISLSYAQMPSNLPTRPSLTVIKRNGIFPLRTKPNKEQKKRLQPHAEDLTKYQQFLRQPRTGIFRLLPDLGCYENMYILKADEVCRNAIPESSFYSFREKEHTIEVLSDIRLKNGYLISDGLLSQGILVKLGDVELEKVTAQNEGMAFLRNFPPQITSVEAKEQYLQIVRGIKNGKHEYKKAFPALENTTYGLRVIAYRGNVFRVFRGFRFDLLEGDKRIDLTLVFRIIRKDHDGTITVLWKEVERKDSPRLKFPKK